MLAVLVALPTGACSNQAEGERCDTHGDNGGNDDCKSGLVCVKAALLNGAPASDRCCPPDRSRSSTDVCRLPSNPVGADSAPPDQTDAGSDVVQQADTAPPEDAPSDAPVDVVQDAPADGG